MLNSSNQQRAFAALQKQYGLKHPTQIKQRIILEQLLAIALVVFGDDKANRRVIERYRRQFKICESAELKLMKD